MLMQKHIFSSDEKGNKTDRTVPDSLDLDKEHLETLLCAVKVDRYVK